MKNPKNINPDYDESFDDEDDNDFDEDQGERELDAYNDRNEYSTRQGEAIERFRNEY